MDILSRAESLWADREAIVEGERRFTYRQVVVRVRKLAKQLANLGINRGDVVSILAPNCTEFFETYYACTMLGAILNPINYRFSKQEIAFILQDSGAKALVVHSDKGQIIDEMASAETEARDVVHLYYTSGTTGDHYKSHPNHDYGDANEKKSHSGQASGQPLGLRKILSGGAPIAPEVVRKVVDTFKCDYVQTYGMTETSPYLTVSLPQQDVDKLTQDELLAIKSRTGRPFLGVELRVVKEDGSDVERMTRKSARSSSRVLPLLPAIGICRRPLRKPLEMVGFTRAIWPSSMLNDPSILSIERRTSF
ncbi:unnamed protein product [Sphagnum jensenii]